MAIQEGDFLRGMVGPVVLYKLNGKQVTRSRPTRKKRAKMPPGQKAVTSRFGQAAHICRMIRTTLSQMLPDYKESAMRYRFDDVMRNWLKNGDAADGSVTSGYSFIDQFQFNTEALLTDKLKFSLAIDWDNSRKVILNIPKLVPANDIAAPPNTISVKWKIAVLSCAMDSRGDVNAFYFTDFEMKYNNKTVPANKLELPFVAKPKNLVLVVLGLKYTAANNETVTDRKWLPVGIVGTKYGD